jgi:hypothetical protein
MMRGVGRGRNGTMEEGLRNMRIVVAVHMRP